jgi:hypothetical protein
LFTDVWWEARGGRDSDRTAFKQSVPILKGN